MELRICQSLRHPNIVSYLGHEYTDQHLYIFLEFMPGGSMSALLAEFGALSEDALNRAARDVLLGLDFLHTRPRRGALGLGSHGSAAHLAQARRLMRAADVAGCRGRRDARTAWRRRRRRLGRARGVAMVVEIAPWCCACRCAGSDCFPRAPRTRQGPPPVRVPQRKCCMPLSTRWVESGQNAGSALEARCGTRAAGSVDSAPWGAPESARTEFVGEGAHLRQDICMFAIGAKNGAERNTAKLQWCVADTYKR